MKEVDIVKELCEIMGVRYSHYDNHRMTKDYFSYGKNELDSIPKIVVYSGMSPWQFAVLEDMTVITPMSKFYKTFLMIEDSIIEESHKKMMIEIKDEMQRVKNAEKYLKDNNCSVVINDKNKRINHI